MSQSTKLQAASAFRSGTIAGLGLALFLWTMQLVSGHKVFVLLLNVDFIPFIGSILWPKWMEVIFHLIISWVIAFIYILFIRKKKRTGREKWSAAFVLAGGAAFSYFPLAVLAEKQVPALNDMSAILFWFIGHGLYAFLLKTASRTAEK